MKTKLFKVLSQCSKVLQYVFIFCSFIMILGTILVLLFKGKIVEMMNAEQYMMGCDNLSLPFIIATCISALIILICIVLICGYFQKIMENLSREQYFVESNSKNCLKIFVAIIALTLCQLLSRILFGYLKVYDVSYLFEFSLKDYFLNILFLVISYSAYLMFQRGKTIKDDSESII